MTTETVQMKVSLLLRLLKDADPEQYIEVGARINLQKGARSFIPTYTLDVKEVDVIPLDAS
jgi:hypothetical protein